MYVSVRFYRPTINGYGGAPYTYLALIDVRVGDEVIAPTKYGDQRAIVVDVDVPKPTFFEAKRITKYWEPEQQEGAE